jgi:hypothetical protein
MIQRETEILRDELGLVAIDDPDELRSAVAAKLAQLNPLERIAVKARIGRRIKEAEEMQPGASYSPPSGNLVFAAIIFLALTFLGGLLVFNTHLWLALKIVIGLLAVFWLLAAGAALRRVWYRRAHGCDR